MTIEQDESLRFGPVAIAGLGTCLCCALAIVFYFGLLRAGTVDPFRSHFEQVVAALRTALVATVASLWAILFGLRGKHRLAIAMLRTGLAMQFSLTLYALLGWRSPSSLNLIFPSTFFAEYNWLTFIFEVAPTTAIAASLLSVLCHRRLVPLAKNSGCTTSHH